MLPKVSCLFVLAFLGFGFDGCPFFPFCVYIHSTVSHSAVANYLFLELHAANTSVVCCIYGWILLVIQHGALLCSYS